MSASATAPSLGRPGAPAVGQPGSPTPARSGAPGPARCPGRLRPLAVAALLALVALFGPLAGGGRPALAEDFVPAPPPAEQLPEGLREVGVTERLGETLPLDVRLRDEAGREVTLGTFVAGKKPLLLQFVYHSCPTLCSLV
ncbi:MAG TPA: hypothetical protein VFS00_13295, partial [Polyangiaceae bacterium]|nr:hypothetical protein [Polyangiaceae bacterium]